MTIGLLMVGVPFSSTQTSSPNETTPLVSFLFPPALYCHNDRLSYSFSKTNISGDTLTSKSPGVGVVTLT